MFSIVWLTFLLVAAVFVGAIVMALRGSASRGWRFELSGVIGDAFVAIGRAPILFAGLAFFSGAMPALVLLVFAGVWSLLDFTSPSVIGLIGGVLFFAWYQLGVLAMVAATLDALDGGVQVGRLIARTLPQVPKAMLVSLFYWLAVLIGFSFFAVPGIILACVWMLVMPVIAAERASLFAAFSRSAALTRGVRWHLFLLAVIGFVFLVILQAMLGGLAVLLGGGIVARVAMMIATALLGVLPPAIVASAYRTIVAGREGPRQRDLEQIFA